MGVQGNAASGNGVFFRRLRKRSERLVIFPSSNVQIRDTVAGLVIGGGQQGREALICYRMKTRLLEARRIISPAEDLGGGVAATACSGGLEGGGDAVVVFEYLHFIG
jgi:hypothetical protein